jgi:sec-independent protein translocase protein TatC
MEIHQSLYEKKNTRKTFMSPLLYFSFLGVLFGYFVIVPMSVNFFATFTVSTVVKNQFSIDSLHRNGKTSVIACLFFELPIIIYFLTKLGLVTPNSCGNTGNMQ